LQIATLINQSLKELRISEAVSSEADSVLDQLKVNSILKIKHNAAWNPKKNKPHLFIGWET